MLNVNELTSRMAKMSDAQLRQYAQLHKNDPYVLALAASESKRRAQLRTSAQQQMFQGPQPTVADQTLAEMGAPAPRPQLPEEQGIGVLPAENVAGMADGGIAGYGDSYAGGGMVAFAGNDGSLVTESSSSFGRMLGFEPSDLFRIGLPNQNIVPEGYVEAASPERRKLMDRYAQLRGAFGTRKQTPAEQAEFKQLEAALFSSAPVKAPAGAPYKDTSGTTYDAYGNPMTAPTTAQPTKTTDTVPQPFVDSPAGRNAAARRPGVAARPTPMPTPAADFVPGKPGDLAAELERLKKMGPGTEGYDALRAKVERGFADLEKAREASKPKEKAYEGLEALLGKEEEKAKGKEARNLNMALINAGLAIAGGRSQYALQNIAEGAQVGTKQYQEGLDKLEAAALERRKQAAMIEEARRAEARGDWKEFIALKEKAFEAGLGVDKAKIEGVAKIWDTNIKNATDIVNNQNTLASADRRTQYQEQMRLQGIREQNINELAKARIMASAYAGRGGSPVNLASDNAAALLKIWQGTTEGKLATPEQLQAAYDRFYAQEAAKMGLPIPSPTAGPGNIKFLGFEK